MNGVNLFLVMTPLLLLVFVTFIISVRKSVRILRWAKRSNLSSIRFTGNSLSMWVARLITTGFTPPTSLRIVELKYLILLSQNRVMQLAFSWWRRTVFVLINHTPAFLYRKPSDSENGTPP